MKKIIAISLIIFLFTAVTNAEESTGGEEDPWQCATSVATEASVSLDNYLTFLEDYYKIDTPSSEQVENGMSRYRFFIDEVQESFQNASAPQGGKTFEDIDASYTYCKYVRDQYLNFGKKLLTVFAIQSANSKRTYKVVDALKAINENMSDFSLEFSQTFPQMFQQMDNALPCYAKSCQTK